MVRLLLSRRGGRVAAVTAAPPRMDADGLFAQAVVLHQAGDLEGAGRAYLQVIGLRPDAVAPYVNLAMAWQGLGRIQAAIAACRQAIARQPQSAAAHSILGNTLLAAGQPAAALSWLARAVTLDAASAEACNALGSACGALGRTDQAIAAFRRAIALAPGHGQPYNNLAAALIGQGEIDLGVDACRRALILQPDNAEAENNLGNALSERGLVAEAIAAFRQALAHRPLFPEAATNLSGALIDLGQSGEAVGLCRQAIADRPDFAEAYNNLGNALRAEGRLDEALTVFRRALALTPDDAEVHFNTSAILLKLGFLAEGWRQFEWRKHTERSAFRRMTFARPEWDGRRLDGRTILLYAEQGLGDVLQFARFAPLVAEHWGGRVVLRVYPSLVRLLRSVPGVSAVLSTEAPLPDFDCQLPLMSLPAVLGTDLAGIPADIPYLHPDPADVRRWGERLAGLDGLKIGLVWAGDPRPHEPEAHRMDGRRSLCLAQLSGLAGLPGISLVSLQKGTAAGQAKAPPAGMSLYDPMDEVEDFADTAALAANLDLVISVDTSVAHLAGAIGRPVWILSRFDGCWRWLDGRDDSPWYPTARLFRQTAPGDWGPILGRLAEAVRRVAA